MIESIGEDRWEGRSEREKNEGLFVLVLVARTSSFKQIRHSDERTSVYAAPVSTEPTLALNHRNNVGSLGYVHGKANRVELLRPMKR